MSPVALTTLGFRRGDATDVRAFQAGWALGPALDVDGLVGPKTTEAMELSVARLKAGQGSASRFFSFTELACECSYSDCRKIWVRRGLLKALDVLREKHYPGGLTIVSGCRCTRHNADVYRAKGQKPTDSIHIYGAAVDIPPTVPVARVESLRLFSGIGTLNGKPSHVDVRHLVAGHSGGHDPAHPARWAY